MVRIGRIELWLSEIRPQTKLNVEVHAGFTVVRRLCCTRPAIVRVRCKRGEGVGTHMPVPLRVVLKVIFAPAAAETPRQKALT